MQQRSSLDVFNEKEPPKILLVDDEATGRRLLKRWIERCFEGRVVEAENGLEALEALAVEEFDLVVLDLMMPVLDGTETLSLIRSDPSHGDVEVVIVSQLASEQKIKDVISLGVADYILKPLRYESVVDRLRQIIERARKKKKERKRHSDLQGVLIADPDPNFCDFAGTALAGRFRGIIARTAAEALVGVVKNEPDLILLSSKLPGLPFEILGRKVLALAQERHGKVCLITDTAPQEVAEGFSGFIVRTFVPENFTAAVARLMAGGSDGGGQESWMKALEPEVVSALRQALGMMTGFEPVCVDQASGPPDLFGCIGLRAESGEFNLQIQLHSRRSFAVALCTTLLGGEASDVDNEFLISGVGEIMNVVGGRIKNSCGNRKIDVILGLPEFREVAPAEPAAFYEWKQNFTWQEHDFLLSVRAVVGAPPAAEGHKSSPVQSPEGDASGTAEATAESSPAAPQTADAPSQIATEAPVEAPVVAAGSTDSAAAAPAEPALETVLEPAAETVQ